MKEAANALRWCVAEMERRYRLMAALKVRNIAGFNRKVLDALATGRGWPIRSGRRSARKCRAKSRCCSRCRSSWW